MSIFNINLADIASSIRGILPRDPSFSHCACNPQKFDSFELQAPIAAGSKPSPKMPIPPIQTNIKRLKLPTKVEVEKQRMPSAIHKTVEKNDHRALPKLQVPIAAGSKPSPKIPAPPIQANLKRLNPAKVKSAKVTSEVWEAAEKNDLRTFFTLIQKNPSLLIRKDKLGRTPMDLIPESRQKTELYERIKPLLSKYDVDMFVNTPEKPLEEVYLKEAITNDPGNRKHPSPDKLDKPVLR